MLLPMRRQGRMKQRVYPLHSVHVVVHRLDACEVSDDRFTDWCRQAIWSSFNSPHSIRRDNLLPRLRTHEGVMKPASQAKLSSVESLRSWHDAAVDDKHDLG